MINWNTTIEDAAIIMKIAKRAVRIAEDAGIPYKFQDAQMDITAAHLNGCPLDLLRLAKSDTFNFSHDIFGIRRHLNRTTGRIDGKFLPRFAKHEVPA